MKTRLYKMLAVAGLCGALVLPGCSFNEVVDDVMGEVGVESVDHNADADHPVQTNAKVDDSLDKPEFAADIAGTTYVVQGSPHTITSEAKVSDGGQVTYQWYINNVNSNSGGTPIDGAQRESYSVDTSQTGTEYYYVVAVNHGSAGIRMTTSNVHEVIVIESGTWEQDEMGGYRYIQPGGKYPVNLFFVIDGYIYLVEGEGHRVTGLWENGPVYIYFDEDGHMLFDTVTKEGYEIDASGIVTNKQVPTEEEKQAAAEQAAEQASAEQAPAEPAPEEQPAAEEPAPEGQPAAEEPAP